jgi:hypothetical protein
MRRSRRRHSCRSEFLSNPRFGNRCANCLSGTGGSFWDSWLSKSLWVVPGRSRNDGDATVLWVSSLSCVQHNLPYYSRQRCSRDTSHAQRTRVGYSCEPCVSSGYLEAVQMRCFRHMIWPYSAGCKGYCRRASRRTSTTVSRHGSYVLTWHACEMR